MAYVRGIMNKVAVLQNDASPSDPTRDNIIRDFIERSVTAENSLEPSHDSLSAG